MYARSATQGPGGEEGYIEIPRFKKRELNLNIVRTRGGWQRLSWLGLWGLWLFNGFLGMVSLSQSGEDAS
jgi:hypothetical protein